MKKNVAATVDAYISEAKAAHRPLLKELRETIQQAAPEAKELISYQIPTFQQHGPICAFASFNNHCSLFLMSTAILEKFEKELEPYFVKGVTLHFTKENRIPLSLVKKMVKLKVKENLLRNEEKTVSKKLLKESPTDSEKVKTFMDRLSHPLKDEIEAIRKIISGSDKKLSERIKWNAPSYYYKEDIVTFNPRATKHVHLVFHHPFITKIKSSLLEGNHKDRRMMYFKDMKEVKANKKELQRIMKEMVAHLDQK